MQYNTTRQPLVMREYGRLVQNIVEKILEEPDRDKRTGLAYRVIDLMVQLNPTIKSKDDYQQTLWDQLYLMTDFRLDVDAPFPPPQPPEEEAVQKRLPYPKHRIERRHYGAYVAELVQRACEEEDLDKRADAARWIGSFMKMVYKNWHHGGVSDSQVKGDLRAMSNGLLDLDESVSLNALAPKGRNKRGAHDNVVSQHYESATRRKRKRYNRGRRRR
jgi:hypothetical protein